MGRHPTHGETVYGPGYHGRNLTPENVRNPPLRRRGLLGRWYAVTEVQKLLDFMAVDIESRMNREEGLHHTIGQLRMQNDTLKLALRQWQSEQAQELWQAQHPSSPP